MVNASQTHVLTSSNVRRWGKVKRQRCVSSFGTVGDALVVKRRNRAVSSLRIMLKWLQLNI